MEEKEVLSLIAEGENKRIDFKRELDLESGKGKAKFVKYVVALANSAPGGGYLLIGVDDDKSIVGINELEEERIQQIAREYVEPPVVLRCVLVPMETFGSPSVGVIEVKATRRPHKVIRAIDTLNKDDVFVRRGSIVAKASLEEIRKMQGGGTRLLWGVGVIALAALFIAIFSAIQATQGSEPTATTTSVLMVVSAAAPTKAPQIVVATEKPTPTSTSTGTPETPTPTPTPTPTLTSTPTPKPVAVVQAETLSVHGGPGTEYDLLGRVKQGDELEIVARTERGDWLQVRLLDGKEGWVSTQEVELGSGVTVVPVATSIPPTPTPAPPTDTPTPSVPQDMVYVPAGEFIMGSSDAEVDSALTLCSKYLGLCERKYFEEEQPQHMVYLDAFWIDKTEVTNAQYQQCVKAGLCQVATTCDWGEPTYGDGSKAGHPVVCVCWYDAKTYCEWAGARLPTEAEWEKAARGTDGWIYPWGNVFDGSKLNFCDVNCPHDWKDTSVNDGYIYTAPVGSYPAGASPYGALDMVGNVWEWVADWFEAYPGSSFQSPYYGGQYRVIRGGAWYPYVWCNRCAGRYRLGPWHGNPDIGFRCVRNAE